MQLFNLLSFIVIFFFFIHLLKHLKILTKSRLPPGPWKLPFIGSIHHVNLNALTHHSFRDLSSKYGPLFHLKLGQVNFIVASSSSVAYEVLKTHDQTFASRPTMLAVKTIAYDSKGIGFSPFGSHWRQLRKICSQELLSTKKVKSFCFIRDEEGQKLLQRIKMAGESKVNMTEIFMWVVNGNIMRAAFGTEFGSKDRLMAALRETMNLLPLLRLADLFPSFQSVICMLDGSMARMKKVRRELDAVFDEIIKQHLEKKTTGEESVVDSFLHILLRLQEKGEVQSSTGFNNVKAVLLDMLIGGTETTSGTLDWAMTELVRHPEAMLKAQLEVRETCKGKTRIEESDINELHYLGMVIKETLRLHPPLPLLIPRICTNDTELLEFTIPAKTWVVVNAWAIGRDPSIWKDPESFCPERFNESMIDYKGMNYEYIPFGSGRRVCPGMTFSLATMEHILAILLMHFDWKLPDNAIDLDEGFGGSARRKNDLYLFATPYSSLNN